MQSNWCACSWAIWMNQTCRRKILKIQSFEETNCAFQNSSNAQHSSNLKIPKGFQSQTKKKHFFFQHHLISDSNECLSLPATKRQWPQDPCKIKLLRVRLPKLALRMLKTLKLKILSNKIHNSSSHNKDNRGAQASRVFSFAKWRQNWFPKLSPAQLNVKITHQALLSEFLVCTFFRTVQVPTGSKMAKHVSIDRRKRMVEGNKAIQNHFV